MTMPLLPKISRRRRSSVHQDELDKKLIQFEANIGGQLFGPIPQGHQRQFFCLDEHTWVWHEAWQDKNGKPKSVTTRYDVRPTGVLKLQNNGVYQQLSDEEARNLYLTTQLYRDRVKAAYQQLFQGA
jgi:hypothetical protein